MFKVIFLLAVATTGFIEWLKKFLPAKVVESKVALASISGAISVAISVGFVFAAEPVFGLAVSKTVGNFIVYSFGTLSLVQVSYNVLLQTFKAIVAKLKAKVSVDGIDTESVATEIADKIADEVVKAVEDTKKK